MTILIPIPIPDGILVPESVEQSTTLFVGTFEHAASLGVDGRCKP